MAVRGKLVPQATQGESGADLLEEVYKSKGKEVDRHHKLPKSNQGEIPESWVWTTLGEIAEVGTGSTPSRASPAFWEGGHIPWITSGSTGLDNIQHADGLVTTAALESHRLKVYRPGTLLVALYGQGKTRGQVSTLRIAATINQACAAISNLPNSPDILPYLKILLRRNYHEIRSHAAGGPQPNLNLQKIKDIPVPLPCLSEQQQIVAKVDELMELCNELETTLAEGSSLQKRLMPAIISQTLMSVE